MSSDTQKLSAVPTNIITGFLGTGKTTAILHLLNEKPENERWAVLVNEFGEIGVDAALVNGQRNENDHVFIREVPGGCMCCAAGLPMQIALNQLLSRANPDRLLIEPTGLGHPKEVLEVLSADHYQDVLSLNKIITLVDARKLTDTRYTEHETFNQQIAIADLIVGNKSDLYEEGDKARLEDYAKEKGSPENRIAFTEHAKLSIALLDGLTKANEPHEHRHGHEHHHEHSHHSHEPSKPLLSEAPLPEKGYLKANNHGEGFESVGWRFSPEFTFDRNKLFSFLSGIQAERMKAVFITEDGVFGYNLTSDALTEMELDDCIESRIEIITDVANTSWEKQLMSCMIQSQ